MTIAGSDTHQELEDDPPAGFEPSRTRGPFSSHNGPFYHKTSAEGFWHGLRLRHRHCNSRGIVHGGMLMTFADGVLATAVFREVKRPSVTMKINAEFLASAKEGGWLQGTAHVTQVDGDVVFVRGHIESEGRQVVAATGVFKLLGGEGR